MFFRAFKDRANFFRNFRTTGRPERGSGKCCIAVFVCFNWINLLTVSIPVRLICGYNNSNNNDTAYNNSNTAVLQVLQQKVVPLHHAFTTTGFIQLITSVSVTGSRSRTDQMLHL